MKMCNIITLFLFIALLGCSDKGKIKSVPLVQFFFKINNEDYGIMLPEVYEMQSTMERITFSIPRRNSKPLELETSLKSNTAIKYKKMLKLKTGLTLYYSISYPTNAGSGGQESQLIGLIDFDDFSLVIRCGDQNELKSPDAKWCLQYLHFLKKLNRASI